AGQRVGAGVGEGGGHGAGARVEQEQVVTAAGGLQRTGGDRQPRRGEAGGGGEQVDPGGHRLLRDGAAQVEQVRLRGAHRGRAAVQVGPGEGGQHSAALQTQPLGERVRVAAQAGAGAPGGQPRTIGPERAPLLHLRTEQVGKSGGQRRRAHGTVRVGYRGERSQGEHAGADGGAQVGQGRVGDGVQG